jgi:hypothetical protein
VQRGFTDWLWDGHARRRDPRGAPSETETLTFMARLAANLCTPVNASTLATDVGLRDNERVNDRIHDLVTAFLLWRCYKDDGRGLPSPAAQRKAYFVDPLIARLPHLRNRAFPIPDASRLSQQQLGLALNRSVSLDRPSTFIDSDRVMYARFGRDAAIDFVGPDLVLPFESRYEDRPWRRATATMRAHHGRGVLATRTPFAIVDAQGAREPGRALPTGLPVWLPAS